MARKKVRHWALTGCWWGVCCGILRGNQIPPFAAWNLVSRREWLELREEGFYTRRSRSRPTAYVDREYQRNAPFRAPT